MDRFQGIRAIWREDYAKNKPPPPLPSIDWDAKTSIANQDKVMDHVEILNISFIFYIDDEHNAFSFAMFFFFLNEIFTNRHAKFIKKPIEK